MSKNYKDWKEKVYTKGHARQEKFESISFIEQPELVTSENLKSFDEQKDLGYPGEFPFTRGVYSSGYRGKIWTMRQFAGFGSPEDTNKRFKYLLEQGQTGLSTAFDMPTLMGYDSDHKMSRGEVGREGVAVSTIEDMERLFDGIALDQITTSMTINCSATIIMAMYLAVARRRKISWDKVGGTIQNDILKEYIAQKEWICPPEAGVKLTCDIIEFCAKKATRFHPVSISGYHIRESGSTAVQELAFTIADGIAYVEDVIGRGLAIDDFAPRLSFFFDIHNDFFEEIAKLRAARRIWAHLMRDRFSAKNEKSMLLRMHAQTAGVSLTAQEPINNVARVAIQALAGVLGGVQSLHTNSMDETLALPTENSVKVALRTQQIIAEETGVANVIDPLGGSYYVEYLTDLMETQAMQYINKIDELGGMLKAVNLGYPQKEIADASYNFQKKVDSKEYVVVGVNKYGSASDYEIPTLQMDLNVEQQQIEKTKSFKAKRSDSIIKKFHEDLRNVCKENKNVMEVLIDAVDAGVTLGEVSDIYREVYGVYRDPGY